MQNIQLLLCRFLVRKPFVFFSLLLVLILLGAFTHKVYADFLFLQNQNIKNLSVVDELVVPLIGLTVFCSIFFNSVLSAAFLPSVNSAGHLHLLKVARLSDWSKLGLCLTPILLLAVIPLLYVFAILLSLDLATQLDWVRICFASLGILAISFVSCCFGLVLSYRLKHSITVLLGVMSLIFGWLALEMFFLYGADNSGWRGLFLALFNLRNGLIVYADIASYIILCVFSLSLLYLIVSAKFKVYHIASLILVVALMLVGVANLQGYSDVSRTKKNTLNSELVELVKTKSVPLEVVAVVDEVTNRDEIIAGFKTIKRYFPDSKIEFKPRQALHESLKFSGEFIQLSLGDLDQVIAYPFDLPVKQAFEVALLRMLKRKAQWLTFVEGHGEASPLGGKSSDLSQLYESLTTAGWPVAVQNLQLLPELSDNSQLLIIASSKEAWLTKEINLVLKYLQNGGNLLVLSDPKGQLPQQILGYFGLAIQPGVLIDWQGHQSGTPHPAILIVDKMQNHPTVASLNSVLAFPWSHGWQVNPEKVVNQFNIETVVASHKAVWNELNSDATVLSFDESHGEVQQAFSVAVAFESTHSGQRAVFVGDSHFAANTAINNYANKQFALNLINWLTDSSISELPPSSNLDSSIRPNSIVHWLMRWGFSLVFPMIILFVWLGVLSRKGKDSGD
jgi:hypothetical protein